MDMKSRGMNLSRGILFGVFVWGLLLCGCGKEEGYRMMQIYQTEGNNTIEREDVGSMEAYENLNLISGDSVSVALESFMRLKVDEDKYVFAEEDSLFQISATGDVNKGRTDIQLEKGAIIVEVQNEL